MLAQLDIDAGGRLVEHQHGRRMDQGLGDQQAPPHAARQGACIGVRLVGQADRAQDLVGAALGARHAVEPGLGVEQLARGEEGVEVQLLRHDADRGADAARVAVELDVPDPDAAGGLVDQPGHDVDQGRLAGAVGAEQAEQLAAVHGQADAVEGALAAPLLAAIDLDQVVDFNREVGRLGRYCTGCRRDLGVLRQVGDAESHFRRL